MSIGGVQLDADLRRRLRRQCGDVADAFGDTNDHSDAYRHTDAHGDAAAECYAVRLLPVPAAGLLVERRQLRCAVRADGWAGVLCR